MEPFQIHVYVCDQKKPEGMPSCTANGSLRVIDALRREVAKQGLAATVQVTTCGSLGLCDRGPNLVVYPEGTWYSGVRPEDVPEIVREHFQEHRPVERLRTGNESAVRAVIDENGRKRMQGLEAREKAGVLPDDLQQTLYAFRESRALLTAIELDVFTAVGAGADAAAVAHAIGAEPRATERLLNALVAMDLLVKRDGRFANGPVAARFLSAGAPDDSRAALRHVVNLWPRWTSLTECVRQGTPVTHTDMKDRDDDWIEPFIAAMHKTATFRAPMVVRALDLAGVKRALDVGGGSGAYAMAFARAVPGLHADVLDLPRVVPLTRRYVEAAGLAERVTAREGDIRDERYGSGYDLVFFSAVCHMLSPDENRAMLRKARAALAPGGRVAIHDFVLNEDGTAPRSGALFALNMLVGTSGGSSYRGEEYAAWLGETGFGEAKRLALPGPTSLVVARIA
ncbi:MAG: methyltransferase [Hyphomicrobiales bacterium]